ncbi:RNA polymerase subunit sigma-70 [Staphylococcus epidermidis]|uniref:RNA polymerase subunit sigma-70 n=1 Tax=Staphylococcus epidermidis TaxID=1282 RepID=UPI0020927BAA|nr:RNA polymerase subunit sigma-70 [Staphylococcus epidermidis]MCO6290095.1 RNA polymerase subunit sigma-70 [Staphylococcus epidermidis]
MKMSIKEPGIFTDKVDVSMVAPTFIDDDINEFFEINQDTAFSVEDNENIEDTTLFNEIVTILEPQLTDKEYNILWLISHGKFYKEVGHIFNIGSMRVRQILDDVIEKLL